MPRPDIALRSLIFLAASACSSGLAIDVARVELPDTPIEIGEVAFGRAHRHPVLLRNPGTAAARVRVSASPGLRLSTDAVRVPANASAFVDLFVTPTSYEPISGTLRLVGGGADATLDVVGTVNPDLDGDGFRAIGAGGDDCDDTRADVYPGAPEVCDGVDNDCDGEIDVGAIDRARFYRDADRDGFGDPDVSTLACAPPPGTVRDDTDCDDTRADVNPSATEIADGVDQDCNGLINEHLLVARALPIVELMPDGAHGALGYVELRSRGSATLYLHGVVLTVDGIGRALPPISVEPGALLVFCGSDAAGVVAGRPCEAPLPGPLHASASVSLTALTTFERLDAASLSFDEDRSAELRPDRAASGQNQDPGDWCLSATPLGDGRFGTPGTLDGHCEVEP